MMKKLISLLFTFLFSMVLFSSYGVEFDKPFELFELIPDSTCLLSSETELSEIQEKAPIKSAIQKYNCNIIEENKSKIDLKYEINTPLTEIEPEEIIDELPTEQNSKKKINRKTEIAAVMIPALFMMGFLAAYLLFIIELPWLALALLLIIGIGCFSSLIKSIKGAKEIKKNKDTQKGTLLSVFAGICSVIGLLFTIILIFFASGGGFL